MDKIVIINNWLISGGAEKQGLILAKTLNLHFKVYFCIYYSHKIEDKFLSEIQANNIELVLLKGNHFNKFISFYRFCKHEKVSVIISYLFIGNLINSIIGSILKVKIRIGGIRSSSHSAIKNFIQRFLHNQMLTLSISNSFQGMNECVRYGYDSKKMIVIHNCFEFDNAIFEPGENSQIQIITVARFVDQKDYLTSLKAVQYAISQSQNNNIHYIILGYGKKETKIKEWINKYNLTNNVTIVINPKNVSEYLAKSTIYLSTSLVEGLSNSIMEGMSYSLPILATDVGDNCQLVKNGFNGYLISTGDFELMGKYILELSNNKEKRIEFGKNSYFHLMENFSSKKFEQNYLTIIKKLLEEKK